MPHPRISIHPVCLHGRQGSEPALPAPAADEAGNKHLRARLGERKKRRTKTRLHARSKEFLHRMIERPFQIAEGDVGVDRQPLDLMKHRRVARIRRIVAMHRPGNHNPDRRPHLLHRPNLHRRSMRPQQQPLPLRLPLLPRDKQSILRIPRRMIRRKIQSLEVVVISLDHRPIGHGVTKLLKDANHLVRRLDDRMLRADRTADCREGRYRRDSDESSTRCKSSSSAAVLSSSEGSPSTSCLQLR